jgi:hypothetical protein
VWLPQLNMDCIRRVVREWGGNLRSGCGKNVEGSEHSCKHLLSLKAGGQHYVTCGFIICALHKTLLKGTNKGRRDK